MANNMGKWQNLDRGFFEEVEGDYDFPIIMPTETSPNVNKWIEFDYCQRIREGHNKLGAHFFEDDYKFERAWTFPDRYAEMLQKFGYVLGPDFSVYVDFPEAVRIYNHYRNNWLCRYWQICYNIDVVPTVMWGYKDSYNYCFDGLPKNSIVAVSTVGLMHDKSLKKMFLEGYDEMLARLNPSKILVFSRIFDLNLPGNTEYIRWEIHKGDQLDGNR